MISIEKKKIIGVLGGYGPFATNDFFKLILESTDAKKDWDHMHVIIDNNPRIPSRGRAFLYNEESPMPYMLEGIERLSKAGADFFICPCNSAHYFLRQHSDYPIKFVDMIDLTLAKIISDGYKKIAVMGAEVTVMAKVYESALIEAGIEVMNVEKLEDVRYVIEAAKQNKNKEEAKELMLKLINEFKDRGADAVIYACTELPIILPIDESPLAVYDSSSILAKGAVALANEK
jgi:aspartate racemase